MSTVCECSKFEMVDTKDVFYMLREGSTPIVFDPVPTEGSMNLLTSGTIYNALENIDSGVTSVNGQTGAVVLDSGDIAYESTTVEEELGTINSALTSLESVTEIIDTASGAIASFPDGSGLPMRSLVAQIEPKQDLHGYDAPWAAGGGANKIVATVAGLKSANTSGLWSGDTYTANNVTFEVLTDDGGNITGIKANGTASGTIVFYASNNMAGVFAQGALLRIDGITGGSSTTYKLDWQIIKQDSSSAVIVTTYSGTNNVTISEAAQNATASYIRIVVYSGAVLSNQMFYPMIKLQSDASTTFVPSSNECAITGWTGLSGKRCGKNLLDRSNPDRPNSLVATDGTISGNNNFDTWYFKHVGDFAISLTVTEANNNGRIVVMNADGTKDTTVTLPTTVGRGSATFSLADGQTAYISIRKSATDCQIETGSTASTYEAYTPLPITCSWQSEAGTVYGGTVNVVTGVLTVDWKTVTIDGTGGNGASLNNNVRVRYPIPDDSVVWSDGSTKSGYVICNMFPEGTNAESGTGTVCFHLRANGSHEVIFGFGSSFPGVSTLAEAMAWITANKPVVCYKLAEPVVYQLTPQQISTLLGNNTVFVDTGSVSVTYQASIKGYIDKVLGA